MEINDILRENILNEVIQQVTIDEATFNKILNHHFNKGFIIVTNYRNENSPQENKLNFYQLKNYIKNNGYSFIPVYGGFIENKGTPNAVEVKEPALLVPNYKVGSSKTYNNTDQLKDLGLDIAKTYNQDSFLFKPENSDASYYIDKNGQVGSTFTNKSINDLTKDYFTKLHQNQNKADRRFTFTESLYINEAANGVANAQKRYGELFFNLNNL